MWKQRLIILATLLFAAKPVIGQAREAAFDCDKLIDNLEAAEAAGRLREAQHWATLLIQHGELTDPNDFLRPMALEHLASLLEDEAHFDESERLYQKSIGLWEMRPGRPSLGMADALNGLGSLYNAVGKLEKAEALCRRALAIRVEIRGANNEDAAIAYSNLGVVLLRDRKFQDAMAVAQEALEIWNRLHSLRDGSAVDLNTLALVRLQEHKFAAAKALDRAAIQKCKDFPPPDHWSLVSYLHTLAVIQWDAGDGCEALATFEETVRLLEASAFPNTLEKRNLFSDYAAVLRETGQKKKARQMQRTAKAENEKILQLNRFQQYSVDVNSLLLKRQ